VNWHIALAVLSGVLELISLFPYLVDIVRGQTRPNKVSFSLWTLCQAIAFTAQIEAGPSWSAVVIGVNLLTLVIITILAFAGYGYREQGVLDGVSLGFAAAAVIAWQMTGDPILAIVFAIVADVFASIPTVIKAHQDPWSEHAGAWGLASLAYILSLFSTEKIDVANLAMPTYITIVTCAIFVLSYYGQKTRKAVRS
jgi:hypothetical protein